MDLESSGLSQIPTFISLFVTGRLFSLTYSSNYLTFSSNIAIFGKLSSEAYALISNSLILLSKYFNLASIFLKLIIVSFYPTA